MFFINPFILSPAGGDFESIATVTVGSGGASSIEFTSIPSTYQHLQVRLIARSTATAFNFYGARLRFNSDTGSNYAGHGLLGDGSSTSAYGGGSTANADGAITPGDNVTASIYGASVIDILDYASTSKYKTFRALTGSDHNGAGSLRLLSGLWMNTAAVSTITLVTSGTNFKQHTTATLYGVKAP